MSEEASEAKPQRREWLKRVLIGIVALFVLLWLSSLWSRYEWVKRHYSSYADIDLQMTKEEVQYAAGIPPHVVADPDPKKPSALLAVYQVDGKDPINALPKGRTYQSFNQWDYEAHGHRIDVVFQPESKRVMSISCFDQSDTPTCPWTYSIKVGMDENELVKELGQPTRASVSNGVKIMYWNDFGVEVTLQRRKAYMIRRDKPQASALWIVLRHYLW